MTLMQDFPHGGLITSMLQMDQFFLLKSSAGFSESINEPTHIQTNSYSCIDLILADQPNLFINSGFYVSMHPNCNHQMVHFSMEV